MGHGGGVPGYTYMASAREVVFEKRYGAGLAKLLREICGISLNK